MKNQVNTQILKQIISDNPIQDHIVDFDNFPEGWDVVFNTDEFGSYDEISNEDRKERAENLISAINEMKSLVIIEIKENEDFVTKLQVNATSEKEALNAINNWCKENNSYSENVAREDEVRENVWHGRVCSNDYK